MKKLILFLIFSFIIGCTPKVSYLYKNENLVSKIVSMQEPSIGIVILGNEIISLYDVLERDVQRHFNDKSKVFPVSEKSISVDGDDIIISNSNGNNFDNVQLLLVVNQHKQKIKRKYNKKTETEEYYDRGILKTKKVDYELYTTIVSVKCDIFLYDIDGMQTVVRAIETFSHKKTNKEKDTFSNRTLFGEIENFFDFLELDIFGDREPTTDLDEFPNISNVYATDVGDYIIQFLEQLKKE